MLGYLWHAGGAGSACIGLHAGQGLPAAASTHPSTTMHTNSVQIAAVCRPQAVDMGAVQLRGLGGAGRAEACLYGPSLP